MKSKSIILIALIALIVVLGGVAAFRGFAQSAIQNFNDQSSCQQYIKSQWCNNGYACTDCSQYALGYSIVVNGQVTNKQWGADCLLGSSRRENAHTFCPAPTATPTPTTNTPTPTTTAPVTTQPSTTIGVGYAIINNVCEFVTTNAKYRNAGDCTTALGTATPVTQKICLPAPNTNIICNAPTTVHDEKSIFIGGAWWCNLKDATLCGGGCVGGACIAATCTNTCDTLGYEDCLGTDGNRICQRGADGCLEWSKKQYCQSGEQCAAGKCQAAATVPAITGGASKATMCAAASTCASDYSVTLQLKDCSVKTAPCANGEKCVGGECVGTVQATPTAIPAKDVCVGVSCPQYCDAQYAQYKEGSCEQGTGRCAYAQVVTNSPDCLPKPDATTPTGEAVAVPDRTQEEQGAFWTLFDQYGYYVGGGLIGVLIIVLLLINGKEKKRGLRR